MNSASIKRTDKRHGANVKRVGDVLYNRVCVIAITKAAIVTMGNWNYCYCHRQLFVRHPLQITVLLLDIETICNNTGQKKNIR